MGVRIGAVVGGLRVLVEAGRDVQGVVDQAESNEFEGVRRT